MSFQGFEYLTALCIPYNKGIVPWTACQIISVATPTNGIDAVVMSFQGFEFLTALCIPYNKGFVRWTACQIFSVGTPANGIDVWGMFFQGFEYFSALCIPYNNGFVSWTACQILSVGTCGNGTDVIAMSSQCSQFSEVVWRNRIKLWNLRNDGRWRCNNAWFFRKFVCKFYSYGIFERKVVYGFFYLFFDLRKLGRACRKEVFASFNEDLFCLVFLYGCYNLVIQYQFAVRIRYDADLGFSVVVWVSRNVRADMSVEDIFYRCVECVVSMKVYKVVATDSISELFVQIIGDTVQNSVIVDWDYYLVVVECQLYLSAYPVALFVTPCEVIGCQNHDKNRCIENCVFQSLVKSSRTKAFEIQKGTAIIYTKG